MSKRRAPSRSRSRLNAPSLGAPPPPITSTPSSSSHTSSGGASSARVHHPLARANRPTASEIGLADARVDPAVPPDDDAGGNVRPLPDQGDAGEEALRLVAIRTEVVSVAHPAPRPDHPVL